MIKTFCDYCKKEIRYIKNRPAHLSSKHWVWLRHKRKCVGCTLELEGDICYPCRDQIIKLNRENPYIKFLLLGRE